MVFEKYSFSLQDRNFPAFLLAFLVQPGFISFRHYRIIQPHRSTLRVPASIRCNQALPAGGMQIIQRLFLGESLQRKSGYRFGDSEPSLSFLSIDFSGSDSTMSEKQTGMRRKARRRGRKEGLESKRKKLLSKFWSLPPGRRDETFPGTREASLKYGPSTRTLQEWIKGGRIRAFLLGSKYRIDAASLREHLHALQK